MWACLLEEAASRQKLLKVTLVLAFRSFLVLLRLRQVSTLRLSPMGMAHGAEGFEDFGDGGATGVGEAGGDVGGGYGFGGFGKDFGDGFDAFGKGLWPFQSAIPLVES